MTQAEAILGDPSHDRPCPLPWANLRVIALGQAPSRDGDPTLPLTGRPMRFLCLVMGMHYLSWCACTQRFNLIREFPGYVKGGDAFPMDRARAGAQVLLAREDMRSRRFVLCWGNRVAEALGAKPPPGQPEQLWFGELGQHLVMTIPHPSGRNRWWNDRGNRTLAAGVLRTFWLGAAQEGAELERRNGWVDSFSRRADPRNWAADA